MRPWLILLIFLVVLLACISIGKFLFPRQDFYNDSLPKFSSTSISQKVLNGPSIAKKGVSFADTKLERVYNKNTGSIIDEHTVPV